MSNCEQILKNMLADVKAHQRDQTHLLARYVEKRLDASLTTYYKQLTESVKSLSHFDEKHVLKKLTKGTISK